VGELDEEYIARMEELLGLYENSLPTGTGGLHRREAVVLHAEIRSRWR